MSGHWWRAHDEAVDSPKLGKLSDRLHRCWFNLNCIASANGGVLPPIADVAFKLRMSERKAGEIIAALVDARLYDRRDDGTFAPHNWDKRQFKGDVTDPTNAARQQRYRNRKRNGESNGSENAVTAVTPKRPETETETEKKDAASPPNPEKELFERGKQVLGKGAGGLITKLLKAKNGSTALARAVIEQASEKQDPREYVAKILNGADVVREGEFVWKSGIPGVL